MEALYNFDMDFEVVCPKPWHGNHGNSANSKDSLSRLQNTGRIETNYHFMRGRRGFERFVFFRTLTFQRSLIKGFVEAAERLRGYSYKLLHMRVYIESFLVKLPLNPSTMAIKPF